MPLTAYEIKGTCLHAQPIIFQNVFTKSLMSYNECNVHELLEYFSDLQSLDATDLRNNNQENMPRPTGPPLELRVYSNPRHQQNNYRLPYNMPNPLSNIRPSLNLPNPHRHHHRQQQQRQVQF